VEVPALLTTALVQLYLRRAAVGFVPAKTTLVEVIEQIGVVITLTIVCTVSQRRITALFEAVVEVEGTVLGVAHFIAHSVK
jgi:hypothetical protein